MYSFNLILLFKVQCSITGNEYGLSKDLDVVLWMAHREYCGKPQLKDLIDFVIIDTVLHDDFDSFKASTVQKGFSFVPVNELLSLYCSMSSLEFSTVQMFGYSYVKLSGEEMDALVDWMLEMRDKYKQEGEVLFSALIVPLLSTIG